MRKLKLFWAKTRKFMSYVGAVFTLFLLLFLLVMWRLILVPFVWVEVGTLHDVVRRYKVEKLYRKAKKQIRGYSQH